MDWNGGHRRGNQATYADSNVSGRKLVNCDPNYAFAADLPCRPQPCFTAVFTPIVFTDFVRVIGSITSPALVDTFGVHSAADAFIVFHCFPSGCRTLRSYCSRDVNGKGTPSTFFFSALRSIFSFKITCFKPESLRFACFGAFLMNLGFFRCSVPVPPQDPHPGTVTSSSLIVSRSTNAAFSWTNSSSTTLSPAKARSMSNRCSAVPFEFSLKPAPLPAVPESTSPARSPAPSTVAGSAVSSAASTLIIATGAGVEASSLGALFRPARCSFATRLSAFFVNLLMAICGVSPMVLLLAASHGFSTSAFFESVLGSEAALPTLPTCSVSISTALCALVILFGPLAFCPPFWFVALAGMATVIAVSTLVDLIPILGGAASPHSSSALNTAPLLVPRRWPTSRRPLTSPSLSDPLCEPSSASRSARASSACVRFRTSPSCMNFMAYRPE
eukprot:m.266951 g.266951  ORF g.266951 m.266951 type:complete len:445 (-) comp26773_c0_seq3:2700-4034(-)